MFPVKTHHPLVRNLKPNFSKDDMKRKKLLLNLLVFMSKDLAALQVGHTLDVIFFFFFKCSEKSKHDGSKTHSCIKKKGLCWPC